MDCRSPGSSVHGISYSRILEWAAISFSLPDPGLIPACFAGRFFAPEPPGKPYYKDRYTYDRGLPQWLTGKESAYNARDTGDIGSIDGWGRSSEEGNGNPLQHFCQKNFMDREAWRAPVHGVTKNRT